MEPHALHLAVSLILTRLERDIAMVAKSRLVKQEYRPNPAPDATQPTLTSLPV